MEPVRQLLGEFGSLVQSTAVIFVVIVLMSVLRQVLKSRLTPTDGKRFRNQLVMLAAYFFAVLMIILGLPLEPSLRGQLLTLLGILISAAIALSSSTMLSNAMAGIMLKSVRNFRSGDFIRVEEHFGRVTERGLFHTEIQTPNRDLTTLPNLLLATTAVNVYRSSGTIVSATVSLGYDVGHTRAEELLLKAARKINLEDAFVQILELGDFSVTYRIAGLLKETKQMLAYSSRLRGAMLDVLHGDGVEIVSPDFNNARVFPENRPFIPAPSSPKQARTSDAAPVDVVFDKAEEAESVSRLQKELQEIDAQVQAIKESPKTGSSDHDEVKLKKTLEDLEVHRLNLEKHLKAALEREREHDE